MHKSMFDPQPQKYRVFLDGKPANGCVLASEEAGVAICYVHDPLTMEVNEDGWLTRGTVRRDDFGRPMLVEKCGTVEIQEEPEPEEENDE